MTPSRFSDRQKLVGKQIVLVAAIVAVAFVAPGFVGILVVPIIAIFLVYQKRTSPRPTADNRPTDPLVTCGTAILVLMGLFIAVCGTFYAFEAKQMSSYQLQALLFQAAVAAAIMLLAYIVIRRRKRLKNEKAPSNPTNDLE